MPAAEEMVRAYVPRPLPPAPPVNFLSLLDRLTRTERALCRLDGITRMRPRQELFLYMSVRKEAILATYDRGHPADAHGSAAV